MKSRELDSKVETKSRLLRQAIEQSHEHASRPARTGHPLLQLQRQHGNRYVQRVLALARKADGRGEATPEVEETIRRAHGGGEALDHEVRAQMEAAFGADFTGVRVHTNAEADALNRSLNARAFTTGQEIFFSQGAYNPRSSSGRELLAHELTHVVQQTGGVRPNLTVSQPGDKYEQEADEVARAVMQQERQVAQRGPKGMGVRRQIEEEEPVQTKAEDAWIQRQMIHQEDWYGVQQTASRTPLQRDLEDVLSLPIAIDYDVALIPQPTNVSCWAAALAMVVGFRDGTAYSPQQVASHAGMDLNTGYGWSDIQGAVLAWGLSETAPMSAMPDYWATLLETHDPLWVVEVGAPYHAVVVTGMHGSGSPDATEVWINNPWPPNRGAIEYKTFMDFDREFGLGAGANASIVHA